MKPTAKQVSEWIRQHMEQGGKGENAAEDVIIDELILAYGQKIDASPAWQTERPTFGDWWVAIEPSRRRHQRVVPLRIGRTGFVIMGFGSGRKCHIDSDLFTGALWLPRVTPADPFGKGGGE